MRKLFSSYASYVGCDLDELNESSLDVWYCEKCDVTVPVHASDPQAYGPVLCPKCGELCEVQ